MEAVERAIDALIRHGLERVPDPDQSVVLEFRAKSISHLEALRLEICRSEIEDKFCCFTNCIDTICTILSNGRLDLEKRSIKLANRTFRSKVTRWTAARDLLLHVGGMRFTEFTAVLPTPCNHSRMIAAINAIKDSQSIFSPDSFTAAVIERHEAQLRRHTSHDPDRRSLLEQQDAAYEASLRADAAKNLITNSSMRTSLSDSQQQQEHHQSPPNKEDEDLPEWHRETKEERRARLSAAFFAKETDKS